MTQGYGMTEASPVTHWVTDRYAGQMPGKIGPAVPHTECRIVDPKTGVDVPVGRRGERSMWSSGSRRTRSCAVEFIDAIPKSPSGKILRRQLLERAAWGSVAVT